jgi:hypothetical protein
MVEPSCRLTDPRRRQWLNLILSEVKLAIGSKSDAKEDEPAKLEAKEYAGLSSRRQRRMKPAEDPMSGKTKAPEPKVKKGAAASAGSKTKAPPTAGSKAKKGVVKTTTQRTSTPSVRCQCHHDDDIQVGNSFSQAETARRDLLWHDFHPPRRTLSRRRRRLRSSMMKIGARTSSDP